MEPTSNNARKSARKTPSGKSSDEYLANQIADARLALESTLDDLTLDLARAADLRRWVRRYPWAALGTALVAGFTLAHVVTKSKRRHDAATTTDEEPAAESVNEAAPTKPAKKSQARQASAGGWRTTLISALFEILRLAVTQFISASVRQSKSSPVHAGPRADQDGSDRDPDASDAAADKCK